MKFKAILIGAQVLPFGSKTPAPWQVFEPTQHECEKLGKEILEKLTETERKEAYVKIIEIREVQVAEIHTAVEKGPSGELQFAIARSNEGEQGK